MPGDKARSLLVAFALIAAGAFLPGCGGGPPGNPFTPQPSLCGVCRFVYATTRGGAILVFSLDANGLSPQPSALGPTGSTGIAAVSPPGTGTLYLYVTDPQANAIRVYHVSPKDGSLTPGPGPFSLVGTAGAPGEITSVGDTLYVASSGGTISAFNVNADGSLTSVPGSPFLAGPGLSHLAAVFTVAAGSGFSYFLYADAGDAEGSVWGYSIAADGPLTPVPGSPFTTGAGSGPAGMFGHGNYLDVALQNEAAIAVFAIAANGALSPMPQAQIAAGRGVYSLAGGLAPVYAANGVDGTISAYTQNGAGTLSALAGSPYAGAATGDLFSIGASLLAPNADTNMIAVFKAALSGSLTPLPGSPFPAPAPLALTVIQLPVPPFFYPL